MEMLSSGIQFRETVAFIHWNQLHVLQKRLFILYVEFVLEHMDLMYK